ncbi:MAG TPA: hypothetical protein HPP81_01365 [Deltaproteobacteria bacterium]|jgi:hypothetical protein|nr:hypothetical protein [Deltaproteobacteria bacterium]
MSSQKRFFTGQELTERWGIHPSYLSHCLILGLPAFSADDNDVVAPLGHEVTETIRRESRLELMGLSGRNPSAPCPEYFHSKGTTRGSLAFIPFRLLNTEIRRKKETMEMHLKLLFRTYDVLDFEKQYGLYGFNDHSDLSSGDIKGNDEKIENLPMVPPGRLQESAGMKTFVSGRKLLESLKTSGYEILKFVVANKKCPFDPITETPILPPEAAGRLDDISLNIAYFLKRHEAENAEKERGRLEKECLKQWAIFASHYECHDNMLMNCPELDEELKKEAIERLLSAAYLVDVADVPVQDSPKPKEIGFKPEQLTRKTDYRTEQWEKAIPIAKLLFKKNPAITLEEIKSDPAFQACFVNGMPLDDTIRDRLNKAGIKLAPGKRRTGNY